jgi:serine/threonine-protein phosphatase 4 regulatory subunit 1
MSDQLSQVPLFDKLRWDSDWRVRHSALFALPAILPRLPLNHKRTLALETVQALSKDPYGGVRSSVMESLGEVLYSFHNDPGGPPAELVHMFLGREQDKNVRRGHPSPTSFTWMANYRQETAAESFYTDPERPLVCAFNFPAVALTLGPNRWPELRETYADLSENASPKVRKTLTASLGDLAKIIGRGPAMQDLSPIWWKSIRAREEEIRTMAIKTLETLSQILEEDARRSMLGEVLRAWQDGVLRGWREREMVLSLLDRFLVLGGSKACETIEGLLIKGLYDNVAAVRELAIHLVSVLDCFADSGRLTLCQLPRIWNALASNNYQVLRLEQEVDSLATASAYKRRIRLAAPIFAGHSLILNSVGLALWHAYNLVCCTSMTAIELLASLLRRVSKSLSAWQAIPSSMFELVLLVCSRSCMVSDPYVGQRDRNEHSTLKRTAQSTHRLLNSLLCIFD